MKVVLNLKSDCANNPVGQFDVLTVEDSQNGRLSLSLVRPDRTVEVSKKEFTKLLRLLLEDEEAE